MGLKVVDRHVQFWLIGVAHYKVLVLTLRFCECIPSVNDGVWIRKSREKTRTRYLRLSRFVFFIKLMRELWPLMNASTPFCYCARFRPELVVDQSVSSCQRYWLERAFPQDQFTLTWGNACVQILSHHEFSQKELLRIVYHIYITLDILGLPPWILIVFCKTVKFYSSFQYCWGKSFSCLLLNVLCNFCIFILLF